MLRRTNVYINGSAIEPAHETLILVVAGTKIVVNPQKNRNSKYRHGAAVISSVTAMLLQGPKWELPGH